MALTPNEQISALLDNGCDAAEAEQQLELLLADVNAQRQWQRFALIGHVLRQSGSATASSAQPVDISAVVMARVAQEAAVVRAAPAAVAAVPAWLRWFKPLGGVAIAASVALVAVLSVQPTVSPTGGFEEQIEPAFITNPLGGLNPVSYNTVVLDNNPSEAELAQQRMMLQAYMLDHQQQLQLSLQQQQAEQAQQEQEAQSKAND